ncbi:toll/interleukin-1 receptor domain-containing protein [Stenotrophomonas sp. NPDC078853]|uniref:toll/interleukin-1 receptor domain-containing protein n=1 Tax=Stenotrophomonas sp. NPDC078853 TaxID=3364534 RepID=UPI00384FAF37
MSSVAPKIFISYSHDSEDHKLWVRALADRLVKNGVDVVLDQWDVRLGSDLPKFMEDGLTEAVRVLAICSRQYVEKANASKKGGVRYEKSILTAQLMQDMDSNRVIPVIRSNDGEALVPTFLSSRVYLDFRDDADYEAKYSELIYELYGQRIKPRPALGKSPFEAQPEIYPVASFGPEKYTSIAPSGTVEFDYSNNNGHYIFGEGEALFETKWGTSGANSIYALDDRSSIRALALVDDTKDIAEIMDSRRYDFTSRHRSPQLGEIVLWQNTAGYFLATKVLEILARGYNSERHLVKLEYKIAMDRGVAFK